MQKHIIKVLENYKKQFSEDLEVDKYFDFLSNPENKNQNCINRKNFNGHIIVSGFVVHENKTLLLWHKTLERWQQPGGHIEEYDRTIMDSAIREVKEEVGLDVEVVNGIFKNIPINFETHKIPENKSKKEDEHFHFDLMILLRLKNKNQEISNTDEGTEKATWVELAEVKKENNPYIFKTIEKYKNI